MKAPCATNALSEAKASYMRSRGVPVLAYIDDAWYANPTSTFGCSGEVQRFAAAEVIHLGMIVSFLCGYILSDTKCDLKPSRVQKYLGILCDSATASFRVPDDKLRKLHALISEALDKGVVAAKMLETIAGKCVSMSVAIRPASLWAHFMFAAIAKAKSREIPLRTHADLRAELMKWLGLSSTTLGTSPTLCRRSDGSRVRCVFGSVGRCRVVASGGIFRRRRIPTFVAPGPY